jgi:hypothetical protein
MSLRSVSFDDWMLPLHVPSAFAYVSGIILIWVLIVAVRKTDTPDGTTRMEPLVKVGKQEGGQVVKEPARSGSAHRLRCRRDRYLLHPAVPF